ncbi:MAG: type II toxin-antitoxin system VapC family toxin [Vicinamibacterales bacterium]
MILVDTGAMLALLDADEAHHDTVRAIYEDNPAAWRLPWAILPEVDYLVAEHLGTHAQTAWFDDLAADAFSVEWGSEEDLVRARAIAARYRALRIGLVDAVVIAIAERLRPEAIVTLDLKHFGAIAIKGQPALYPRDYRA